MRACGGVDLTAMMSASSRALFQPLFEDEALLPPIPSHPAPPPAVSVPFRRFVFFYSLQ